MEREQTAVSGATSPDMVPGPVHFVVVPHTHWDREWYQPFQDFRARLVRLIDGLLDVLEHDRAFSHFHLDGQTIVLEDYLEIRPHHRIRLRNLVRSGRIAVGPWYVLPDEFLVSGESIIRNLTIGHRIGAEFGAPPMIGYLPDQFGHIAQMPQILAGFGIDTAVLWRGVGADVGETTFAWEGLDGTRTFTVYLPRSGYSNGRALPEDASALRQRLLGIVEEQAPFRRIPSLLVMNGTDHQEPQQHLPRLLAEVVHRLVGATYEIASLATFVRRSRAESRELTSHVGELRSPLRAHLLPGVTSMRVKQKQRDFASVSGLERYAEPLATWADLLAGRRSFTPFTDWAWKLAVQNHPHDSICGCSVDQVHTDMEYRFDQIDMVRQRVVREALHLVVGALDTSRVMPDRALVVYNPNAAGPDIVRTQIFLDEPSEYVLEDHAGMPVPLQVEVDEREVLFAAELPPGEVRGHVQSLEGREFLGLFINDAAFRRTGDRLTVRLTMDRVLRGVLDMPALRERWLALLDDPTLSAVAVRAQTAVPSRVTFCAPHLSGHGLTVFTLRREHHPQATALEAAEHGIENEYFRVTAHVDGTLTVTDKTLGIELPRCNWFVDEGDRGDEYNFDPVSGCEPVAAPAVPPVIVTELSGPVMATLTMQMTYELPRALLSDREMRSPERVAVPISTCVRLYAGVRRIDFETTVDNLAADHRLRVHFPTPLRTEIAVFEQAFGAVGRAVTVEPGDGIERAVGTVPQKTFASIHDATGGIALFNRGVPEVEVRGTEQGTEIALTLIRAVGWLSRGDLRWRRGHAGPGMATPGAQSPGVHRFEYALTTFSGGWDEAAVVTQAHRFAYPPIGCTAEAHPGQLASGASLVECDNERVVISAVTPSVKRQAYVVRCYNASPKPQTATLNLALATSVRAVDLLERPTRAQLRRLRSGGVRVALGPFEILSLQIATAPRRRHPHPPT